MWNVLIVDDEPPIRSELRYLLERDGRCDEIREAGSVTEAVSAAIENKPDVIFLDISMPGTSGMKLAETLKNLRHPPVVVFVTAHAEFAADAFDLDAVDYVLKPIESKRLESALSRVEAALAQRDAGRNGSEVPRVVIERDGRKTFIPVSDIIYVEARADSSYIVSTQGSSLVGESILSLEHRLTSEGFLRVHRSYIVNPEFVHDINVAENGLLELELEQTSTRIPVSRRRMAEVKQRLGIA
mgnify:CR=1 FL=1